MRMYKQWKGENKTYPPPNFHFWIWNVTPFLNVLFSYLLYLLSSIKTQFSSGLNFLYKSINWFQVKSFLNALHMISRHISVNPVPKKIKNKYLKCLLLRFEGIESSLLMAKYIFVTGLTFYYTFLHKKIYKKNNWISDSQFCLLILKYFCQRVCF